MKQDVILGLLSKIRDMGTEIDHPVVAGGDETVERLLQESQRFFPSDWLDESHQSRLNAIRSRRGGYNGIDIAVSNDASYHQSKSTMLHELWHRMEDKVSGIAKAENDFYLRRTKHSKRRETSGSAIARKIAKAKGVSLPPPEFTKRNSWFGNKANGFGEYFGRDYQQDYFEVGTMTIESVFFNTYPIEQETQAFDLILGLLATQ